jgi:glutamine phosphoribosylpyrophosphate amidotransferase
MYDDQIDAFWRLFEESAIRGMHAYGLADINLCGELRVERSFKQSLIPELFIPGRVTIAHARYCQSGDYRVLENNQPIVVDDMALAMNGVIHMGAKAEYEAEFGVTCTVDNDSEIFLQKLKQGVDAATFIMEIKGSFAATWLSDGRLYAGRNARRPLWKCQQHGALWYASTEDIFRRAGFVGAEPVAVGVEQAGIVKERA